MMSISVYDIEGEAIERIASDNAVSAAEIVEALMERIEDVKEDYGWI